MNHGDGEFDCPVVVEGVLNSSYIALGDLDRDSDLDILTEARLTTDGDYQARILLNDGTGQFSVTKSVQAVGLLADLDRDYDLDILGGFGDVLFNNGDATFTPGPFYDDTPVRIEDFDDDGDLDVLAQSRSNYDPSCDCFRAFSLQLYKNAGNGSFAESGEQLVIAPESFYGPEINIDPADLDGDHDLDLAVNARSGEVRVFLNDGTGAFSPGAKYSVPGYTTALVALDLNGDGLDELVMAAGEVVSVLLNSSVPPASSLDINHNSIPDECEPRFHRGDPNSSGATDISDGISLLNFLFLGGPPPAAPGPPPEPCGLDSDAPGSAGDLGCVSFESC